ncbi:unnamed protein product [Tuber melanosporum]|uniref:Peptidyl-prolyl cis-trans isomerase-like 2 n=1 Tax=Tuber melanosporum (strain Mel28) TaxID=656061 RepID=D5GLA5_TUBMM|nr:uncharacterized protein GSTUM_00010103001 [Tuber melanosporum]CAZ85298.1 unnamed protein product [Tuber melanosporum]
MGKGTDKLYITHSEWSGSDSFGASSGYTAKSTNLPFKRLPYNFCAVSLQPFTHPVCTPNGTIFDLTNIIPWLKKHGTNPVTGAPLSHKDLLKLHMAKNEDGEYCDPVTFKVFTDNTHIVAIRTSGNVFAWDTVERLNVRPKHWRDLVGDEEFTRKDIITLQDPQNLESRDMCEFKYLKDGASTLTEEQAAERADPLSGINVAAMGSSAKILAAKAAVAKARAAKSSDPNHNPSRKNVPYNAARHTTGRAAASLTSTSLTPHTGAERALLSDEEYMLRPKRIKIKGYARISTSLGNLNIELHTDYAPKAVYNFVKLAQNGYYSGVRFHRNVRNFMIQGGDPTATGRGGTSHWGKPFDDEFESPLLHDARGILSMANKGKNTNSSQFFITYRAAKHLDRKHTIFGKVVGGLDVLDKMEVAPVGDGDVPIKDIVMKEVVVFVDPFDELRDAGRGGGGSAGEVGKYLKIKAKEVTGEDEVAGEVMEEYAYDGPVKKKPKAGRGFGNFDSW